MEPKVTWGDRGEGVKNPILGVTFFLDGHDMYVDLISFSHINFHDSVIVEVVTIKNMLHAFFSDNK